MKKGVYSTRYNRYIEIVISLEDGKEWEVEKVFIKNEKTDEEAIKKFDDEFNFIYKMLGNVGNERNVKGRLVNNKTGCILKEVVKERCNNDNNIRNI